MNEESLFAEALGKKGEERAAFLDAQCQNDVELRRRLEALLRASDNPDPFLDAPIAAATIDASVREAPGTLIGPYKLLEQIGEGGFGIVFMAEQQQPVRRRVALKILKPGMDTRQVVARFEAERQALAIMDHPNIARVLDGGATPMGRPYFVMELVKGVPITDYCDQNHLTPRQRLELFISVCQAVQHAHQKGMIHRDLKPSNILVTVHDTTPVVKVIDFGVAKAMGQELTDKTLFTGFAQMIGTPLYMSPEQAGQSGLDVDTRSDIYSLGVLLYELLTGTTPFDKERFQKAAYDEIRRIIREEEPPRPSTRLSELRSSLAPRANVDSRSESTTFSLASISAHRQTEPAKLTKLVRGELDWIVMKALEKDRSRRYETANALARDVQRYLAEEPVEACPPSAAYRLRKVLWKYRRPLATGAAFALLLVVGGVAVSWQAVRLAQTERDQAVLQGKRDQEVQAALAAAAGLRAQGRATGDVGRWAEARELAKRAEGLLEGGPVDDALAERVRTLVGEMDVEEKDRRMTAALDAIRLRQAQVKEGSFDIGVASLLYADAFREYGVDVAALSVAEATKRVRRSAIREELLAALDHWAAQARLKSDDPLRGVLRLVADGADDNAWRRSLRQAIQKENKARLKELAADAKALKQPPTVLKTLGVELRRAGLKDEAVAFLRQAQERHPGDFWLNHELGYNLWHMRPRRAKEAVGYYRAAVALRPGSPGTHLNLALALKDQGDLLGAVASNRKAIELDADYAEAHSNLASVLTELEKWDEAIVHCSKAIELKPTFANAHSHLGDAFAGLAKWEKAAASYREAIKHDPKHGAAHEHLGAILINHWKDYEQGIAMLRKTVEIEPVSGAYVNIGVVLDRQGKRQEAIASWKQALEVDKTDASAHLHLGRALEDDGQLAAAIASWQQAIEHNPKEIEAHFALGNALEERRDFRWAIFQYRQVIKLDANHVGGHNNLGNALLEVGEDAEALACFEKASKLNPKLADPVINIGRIFAKRNELNEAIVWFRRATKIDAKSVLAHFNLGIALSQRNPLDKEAVTAFRQARDLDPKDVKTLFQLGSTLDDQGKLEEAIAAYQEVLALDPKSGPTHNNLGVTLAKRGKLDEAIAAYQKAIELDPKDASAATNLTKALRRQAVAGFKEVIELHPKSAAAHYNLGAAWFDEKKLKEAIAALNKAIDIDPNHVLAHFCLGNALSDLGNRPAAVDIDPQFTAAYARLGANLHDLGKLDEAISCYQKAIALDPKYAMPHFLLGNARRDQKKTAESVAAYQKAVELNPNFAPAHTYLAWWLATAADPMLRDPAAAIAHARRAVQLQPQIANHWSNLGTALWRTGEWKGAMLALERADAMLKGGDHRHRFFLAMAYWQLGEKDKARRIYEQGAAWMDKNEPRNEQLRRFREEAAEMLGIDKD